MSTERDFFELYDFHSCLALEVGHNSIADWNVIVYDRKHGKLADIKPVIHVSGSNRISVFAEAYTKLVEYYNEHRGGY